MYTAHENPQNICGKPNLQDHGFTENQFRITQEHATTLLYTPQLSYSSATSVCSLMFNLIHLPLSKSCRQD